MPEPGDHLAVVELSLRTQLAIIQLTLIRFLRFVEDAVKEHTPLLSVREYGFPLPKLGGIVVQIVVVFAATPVDLAGPRPHAPAIAADVHEQEIHAVDVLVGQVIDHTDDRTAAAAGVGIGSPVGIPFAPILLMSRVAMLGKRVVETGVGKKIFRFVGTTANPVRPLCKLQVVLSRVSEEAPLQKARSIGVARSGLERASKILRRRALRQKGFTGVRFKLNG